jgi:hypothetical protein
MNVTKKNGLGKRFKHFFKVSLLTTILTLGPNCSYFPVTIRRTVTQTAVDILIDGLVQAAGHKDEEHERKLDKVHVMCPQLPESSMEEGRSYQKVLWYKTEEYGIIWKKNIP